MIKVNDALFVKTYPDAVIPSYKTLDAACCDISVCEKVTIERRTSQLVGTGLICIPPSGFHWQVYLRSSAHLKFPGLLLANSVGIIDSDYCGPEDELKLLLLNLNVEDDIVIPKHTRIAQMKIVENIRPIALREVAYEEAFKNSGGIRSRGGFGSTG